jgi:arogenate dehydrogenase (NADP+)
MKIGIIGLGLIGGSLGLDLKEQGWEIVGVSRRQENCNMATKKGIVDEASVNLTILKNTDIVFICTPIESITPTLKKIIPFLNSQTIVTDVGSVKSPLVDNCSKLWPNFIGGHPMAGTAEQGIAAAQRNLFAGAAYVLTPIASTKDYALTKLEEIGRSLQAKIYKCSPKDHDQAVAWISHLPVMVSTALISACVTEEKEKVLALTQKLASSGFRDTSRVGGGNPELGLMMAKYNRQQLLNSLEQYNQELVRIKEYIQQEKWENLELILKRNKQARLDFLSEY